MKSARQPGAESVRPKRVSLAGAGIALLVAACSGSGSASGTGPTGGGGASGTGAGGTSGSAGASGTSAGGNAGTAGTSAGGSAGTTGGSAGAARRHPTPQARSAAADRAGARGDDRRPGVRTLPPPRADDPELVPRIPVYGVGLAKPPEERVRVPDRIGGEQVIEVGVRECACHGDWRLGTGDQGLGTRPGGH